MRCKESDCPAFSVPAEMYTPISTLGIGLAMAFGFPVVVFATGRVWFRMVGGSTPRVDKAWATACLLLPIVALGMMVKVGFETIRAVWLGSPILATLAYLFLAGVVPALLIYLIIRLWRPRHGR